jgi:hypothetical protein
MSTRPRNPSRQRLDRSLRLMAMIRTRGHRLGALFLLIAFVAGGYGIADLDALFFHSGVQGARADVPHLDQPGGCGSHSERCALVQSSARPQQVGAASVKIRLNPIVARPLVALAPIDRSEVSGTLPLPRAPPLRHASTR